MGSSGVGGDGVSIEGARAGEPKWMGRSSNGPTGLAIMVVVVDGQNVGVGGHRDAGVEVAIVIACIGGDPNGGVNPPDVVSSVTLTNRHMASTMRLIALYPVCRLHISSSATACSAFIVLMSYCMA